MGNSIKRKRVDGLCGPFAAYDEQSEVNKAKEDSPAQPIIPIQSINPTQQRLIDGWNEWGWNEWMKATLLRLFLLWVNGGCSRNAPQRKENAERESCGMNERQPQRNSWISFLFAALSLVGYGCCGSTAPPKRENAARKRKGRMNVAERIDLWVEWLVVAWAAIQLIYLIEWSGPAQECNDRARRNEMTGRQRPPAEFLWIWRMKMKRNGAAMGGSRP